MITVGFPSGNVGNVMRQRVARRDQRKREKDQNEDIEGIRRPGTKTWPTWGKISTDRQMMGGQSQHEKDTASKPETNENLMGGMFMGEGLPTKQKRKGWKKRGRAKELPGRGVMGKKISPNTN